MALGRLSQTANNDANIFAPQHSNEHDVCSKDWGRACGYNGSGCGSVEGGIPVTLFTSRNETLSTLQRKAGEETIMSAIHQLLAMLQEGKDKRSTQGSQGHEE